MSEKRKREFKPIDELVFSDDFMFGKATLFSSALMTRSTKIFRFIRSSGNARKMQMSIWKI